MLMYDGAGVNGRKKFKPFSLLFFGKDFSSFSKYITEEFFSVAFFRKNSEILFLPFKHAPSYF